MGKHQAFTVPILENGKTLELDAWCLISETFLYFSGVIHLIGRCLRGEVLRYIILYKLPIYRFLITDYPNIPTLRVCWTGNPNTMGLLITDNESTVHCIIIQCLEHGPISYLSQDIARN